MDSLSLPAELLAPHLQPLTPLPTPLRFRGALRHPVHCLLCDVYGTLFISASGDPGNGPDTHEKFQRLAPVLHGHGITTPPDTLLARMRRTIDRHQAAARQKGRDHPEVRIEAVWSEVLPQMAPAAVRRLAIEFEMAVNPVWPMPHLERLLETCRRRGIRLGIVSNAQFFTPGLFQWFLGRSPKALGFDPDLTLWSFRHGVAKPSAALFRLAAKRLRAAGLAPGMTAYIGNDMHKDIRPAARVGFQTVLFAGDVRSLRLEEPPGVDAVEDPDLVVTDLSQLISCLTDS